MGEMLSLRDVLPRHERVDVGDGKVDLFGISGEDIGVIIERFPDAFNQIANAGSQAIKLPGELMGALIAAAQRNGDGSSFLGDKSMELRGRSFGAADQQRMLTAIGKCTFPDGVGPFLESLVHSAEATVEAMDLAARVASRVQAMPSPPTPKPSDAPDTPPSGS
jgi:hypothetical protein